MLPLHDWGGIMATYPLSAAAVCLQGFGQVDEVSLMRASLLLSRIHLSWQGNQQP